MPVISGLGPVAAPSAVGRPAASGQNGFSVPRPDVGPAVQSGIQRTGPAAAISSSTVLALQEQLGREHADENARRHGHRMLDGLARLQRALLADGDPASLDELAELARVDIRDADPALAGVLSSIRLRARIELARRSWAPGDV